MTDSEQRWAAVRDAVLDRMRELAVSQAELVRSSGVSDFTVRKIMNGVPSNYRPANLAKLALALGWDPGAFDDLLDGRRPQLRPRVVGVEDFRELDLTEDVRQALAILAADIVRTNHRVDRMETKLLRRFAQLLEALGMDEDDVEDTGDPATTLAVLDDLLDQADAATRERSADE